MLNSVGERTLPWETPVLNLTLYGWVVSVCCVGFAYLDVVYDEIYYCTWNVGL